MITTPATINVPVVPDPMPSCGAIPEAGLPELLDLAVWQDALEKYARATNLAIALTDPSGRQLGECINPRPTWTQFRRRAPADLPGCIFCVLPGNPCTCLADALSRNEIVFVRRPLGLVHFAVPLQLGTQAVGALVAGQVFEQFPEQLPLERTARECGLSPDEIWHTARAEQPVKPQTLGVYADLLETLGRTVLLSRYHLLVEANRYGEMARLQDLLQQRNQELIEADHCKDEFLAILGHELRNPLAPLRNAIQLLRMWDVPDPDVQWAVGLLHRQTGLLARLVDDLLDVSRVAQNKVELHKEPIDVKAVIAAAVENARPLLEGRRHELTVTLPEEPSLLVADPVRLGQMLVNLLNNAAKYTPPGGHVALSVAPEGQEVVFRVRDTGIGIAPESLPQVTRLFVQADHAVHFASGGLGVGLALVHSLAKLHGGTIQVSSEGVNQGCEVMIRLPASTGTTAVWPDDQARPPSVRGRPLRILVVDDQRDSAESLSILLRMWQFDPRVAPDGPSALELAHSQVPDAAILDIGLPGMDGYEIARRLRRLPGGNQMFLIALTGYGRHEDRRRSQDAGFDLHLVKPVDLEELQRILERFHRPELPDSAENSEGFPFPESAAVLAAMTDSMDGAGEALSRGFGASCTMSTD